MFFARKFKFLGFSLYHAVQKGNQGQNCAHISAYRVMQTLEGLHDAVRTYTHTILPRSLVKFITGFNISTKCVRLIFLSLRCSLVL